MTDIVSIIASLHVIEMVSVLQLTNKLILAVGLHPADLGEKHLIHFQCDFKHN